MPTTQSIDSAYELARERFAELGVDVSAAVARLGRIPVSLHCWQGDDVGGFEADGGALGGGLVATGNHPGKARSPDELRADLDFAFGLLPGKHRLNLHAIYGEFGGVLTSAGNMTDVIDKLHARGLVDRRRCKDDRRNVRIELTECGRQLAVELFPRHAADIASAMSGLSAVELRTLGDLLRQLGTAAERRTEGRASPT